MGLQLVRLHPEGFQLVLDKVESVLAIVLPVINVRWLIFVV
jgi:hypothetical protein